MNHNKNSRIKHDLANIKTVTKKIFNLLLMTILIFGTAEALASAKKNIKLGAGDSNHEKGIKHSSKDSKIQKNIKPVSEESKSKKDIRYSSKDSKFKKGAEHSSVDSPLVVNYADQEIKFPEQAWKVAVSPLQCKLRRENLNGIDFEFMQQAGGNERLIINIEHINTSADKILELALVNPRWEAGRDTGRNAAQQMKMLFKLNANKQQTEFPAIQARQILLALGMGLVPSIHQPGTNTYLIKVGNKLVNYAFNVAQSIGSENSKALMQNISNTNADLGNTGMVLFEQPYFEYLRCQRSILPVTAKEFKYADIYFADGSNILDRDAVVWLKHVVAYLKNDNKSNIKLVKYGNSSNDNGVNESVTMSRVMRIADYLRVAGVPYNKIAITEARSPAAKSSSMKVGKNIKGAVVDENNHKIGKDNNTRSKQGVNLKLYKGSDKNGNRRVGVKISSTM